MRDYAIPRRRLRRQPTLDFDREGAPVVQPPVGDSGQDFRRDRATVRGQRVKPQRRYGRARRHFQVDVPTIGVRGSAARFPGRRRPRCGPCAGRHSGARDRGFRPERTINGGRRPPSQSPTAGCCRRTAPDRAASTSVSKQLLFMDFVPFAVLTDLVHGPVTRELRPGRRNDVANECPRLPGSQFAR